MIAVREELNLHLCLKLDVTDGKRPPLNFLTFLHCLADCFRYLSYSTFLIVCVKKKLFIQESRKRAESVKDEGKKAQRMQMTEKRRN